MKQIKGQQHPYISLGIHLLGWFILGFMMFIYIPLTWDIEIPLFFWIWHSVVLLMMVVLFYANAKLVVPKTIVKGKMGLFLIWVISAILLTQIIAHYYTSLTDFHIKMATLFDDRHHKKRLIDTFVFSMSLLVLAFSTGWAMLMHWQEAASREKELIQDKTDTELAMLKMQINPHFFFNSLNSVYSLTYINVDDSRSALLTLSRMMRYLLYRTGDEMTTISKEIEFLNDYIAVMRMRATDRLKVTVNIAETEREYNIAPMLLLPFAENAFKYGIDASEKSEIVVKLWLEGSQLHLNLLNPVFALPDKTYGEGGVGMTNTRRRLQLLYPGRHKLETGIRPDGLYEVKLQIDL
ncbi:sensor histidine kinase [Flavobacterium sp. RHBU_3]|uniref:sensor histidine kinase n=1 Tax=Flavobacterium sp. RHBU_3 TaxID=3391184 RepID=UPI003984763F